MTALNAELGLDQEKWNRRLMPLKAGAKAYKGGTACIDTVSQTVVPGKASTTLLFLGVFAETIDNSTGATTTPVNVDFLKEKTILWRANDGSISATALGIAAYALDDQTLTATSSGNSKMGTVLAVDSVLGVAIEVEGV